MVENIKVAELLHENIATNFRLLTSGPIPPNPSELLSLTKMRDILVELADDADYVLIDSPPTIAVTDACVLASIVNGVILVLDAGVIRPRNGAEG